MKTNPKNRLARQLRKIKEDKQEKEGVEETEVEKVFIQSVGLNFSGRVLIAINI